VVKTTWAEAIFFSSSNSPGQEAIDGRVRSRIHSSMGLRRDSFFQRVLFFEVRGVEALASFYADGTTVRFRPLPGG